MNYRFLVMDSSGEATRAEEWSCPSDAEAIERALRHPPSFGAELWRGDHHVTTFTGRLSGPSARAPSA
jgi:hypothetical protein